MTVRTGLMKFAAGVSLLALSAVPAPALAQSVTISGNVSPFSAQSPNWNVGGNLEVGRNGDGTLTIVAGGTVSNTDGSIGYAPGSTGTATVSGIGSKWTNSRSLFVGYAGNGSLLVENGGELFGGASYIGHLGGSTGAATVTGSNSTWTNSGSLFVGQAGTGELTVGAGGTVTGRDGFIGFSSTAAGVATVTGSGSSWTSTESLFVGFAGDGALTVAEGGKVGSANGAIGLEAGSTGRVTVTGRDSTLTSDGTFEIGGGGSGVLTVQDSGKVISRSANIGRATGSTGMVTVTGSDSTWINGSLDIGLRGIGSLNVEAGGVFESSNTVLGRDAGSEGTVTVTGSRSNWTNSSFLAVGSAGTGKLTVEAGGTVMNTLGIIASGAGSAGGVTVTGAGSTWINSAELVVGSTGSGTLRVAEGGTVFAGGLEGTRTVTVARDAGSTGTVIVGAALGDSPVAAGRLAPATLAFGNGTGTLVFNHTGNPDGTPPVFEPSITGAGTISHLAGTTVLSGANAYTGATNVAGGTLRVSHGTALGGTASGTSVANGATLELLGGIALAEPLMLGGSGVGGRGALRNLSSNNVVGGPIVLTDGTRIESTDGLLTLSGGISGAAGADRNLTLGGAGDGTVSASVGTNLGAFEKDGTGTWSLKGATSFSRNAVVSGGTLAIEEGGTVDNRDGFIGGQAGSSGAVTVNGSGSRWTNDGFLEVGEGGTGTLTVEAAGSVESRNAFVGNLAGATGTVTVKGGGSTWTNSGNIRIGNSGNGTLTIAAGGGVSNDFATVGQFTNSTGAVTVSGSGSTWTNGAGLTVGAAGTGTLTVETGGTVTNTNGFIGAGSASTGSVTVKGAGSTWTNSGGLTVGNQGIGTLRVEAGGAVGNVSAAIGQTAGSTGAATVMGAGSAWTNGAGLTVGAAGTGTLTVEAGGTVTNGVGSIAASAGSAGSVTVKGAGSSWTSGFDLYVGHSGNGTLQVEASGAAGNTNGLIGFATGSTGSATVAGSGSRWSNSANLWVGYLGDGTLTVEDGGGVSNTNGVIGLSGSSTGTATVRGSGSSWTNSGMLDVGSAADGTLLVEAGGAVSNTFGFIGNQSGAVGRATVTGVGSLWTSGRDLLVGTRGNGTLQIAGGGGVFAGGSAGSGTVTIAQSAGSTGTLIVGAAAGSTAVSAGRLAAGTLAFGNGDGRLVFNHAGNVDGSALAFAPTITGSGRIDHLAGHTVLNGMNRSDATFTGTAEVTGGLLAVNGVLGAPGAPGSARVNVSGTGTLGGSGTVAGEVAIGSGGTLSAGNSPGTLSVTSDMTLAAGSTALFELGAADTVADPSNDLVKVGGALTVDPGATLALRNGSDASLAATSGFYTLFDVEGAIAGRFDAVTNGGVAATGDVTQYVVASGGTSRLYNILVANNGQSVQFWDGANPSADGAVNGGAGSWEAAATNWTNMTGSFNAPWLGGVAVFGGAGGTVLVNGAQSVEGLQFTADGYALSGGSLSLAGNAVGSNGRSFVTVDAGVSATIASSLTGSGGLYKQGAGTLVLTAANAYTGGTELAGGILSVGTDAHLGDAASGLIFSGGTLRGTADFSSARDIALSSSGTMSTEAGVTTTLSGAISGAGRLTKAGDGTVILTGANGYTGGTELAGGILSVGADAHLGDAASGLIFSGGTLRATADFSSARDIALSSSSGTISTDAGVTTTFSGPVSGAGRLIATGLGNVVLTGGNTHTGGTRVEGGRLTLSSGGSLASGVDNRSLFRNEGIVSGGVVNTGLYEQFGGSTLGGIVTSGRFEVRGGTLAGPIENTGLFLVDGSSATDGTFANDGPNGLLIVDGALSGITTLRNDSDGGRKPFMDRSVYVTNGSNLTIDILAGTNAAAVTHVDGTLSFADAPYAGRFAGSGRIEQRGGSYVAAASGAPANGFSGVYDLSGTMEVTDVFGDVAGRTTVVNVLAGGHLRGTGTIAGTVRATGGLVDGSVGIGGDTIIGAGGTLAGTPSVAGNLQIGAGGTLSPGNSPGTITVAGNAAFAAGSTYLVETVPGTGVSDRLDVQGRATIEGGSVRHIGLPGDYRPSEIFTILTAEGGVTGTFSDVSSDYIFLVPSLQYGADAVTLTLARNAVAFDTVAQTANQRATARALDALPTGDALPASLAALDAGRARDAFDQLSGEVHAAARGALAEGSRHLRDTVSSRIEDLFSVVAQGADLPASEARHPASGLWIDGFGSFGRSGGNGNAARAERDFDGAFVGVDRAVGASALAGLFAGYSRGSVEARNGSADIDSAHVGAYGAAAFGALELSAGAAYSYSRVETERSVAFAGFADRLSADYDAGTTQIFGEVGYRVELGGVGLKPFASLAYVHRDGDGFAEEGGAASLTGAGASMDTLFTTLGLRANTDVALGGRMVSARGVIGWQHASGDLAPSVTNAFSSGAPFTVEGVPIGKDAALVSAGFATDIAPNVSASVDYVGRFADGVTENGFRLGLAARF